MPNTNDLNQDELIELQSTPYVTGCAERVHTHSRDLTISTMASQAPNCDPKFYAVVKMPGCFRSTELFPSRSIALEEGKQVADRVKKNLQDRLNELVQG